jgi:acyl carrier protein
MTEAEIYAALTRVFRDVLDAPTLTLTEGTRGSDIPGWDSMAYVNIITGTETEVGVEFTTAEIDAAKTVGDLAGFILAKKR